MMHCCLSSRKTPGMKGLEVDAQRRTGMCRGGRMFEQRRVYIVFKKSRAD